MAAIRPAPWVGEQEPGHPRHGFAYVPALDGVRAWAVIAVLGFHGGMACARGAFLGVDAFFVLSGFLITGLLLAEWERTGRIALATVSYLLMERPIRGYFALA